MAFRERLRTDHAIITIERGRIVRIERGYDVDYAGPCPDETLDALREVAR